MKPSTKTQQYMAKIGSFLTTTQFAKLQIFLGQIEVPARMGVLYRQLEKEIETEQNE